VKLMEMLARWVPTTPEMEIKVLFGRHVWECAQHADALGRRAFELRAPLHYTLAPVEHYAELLREAAQLSATGDRVNVFYDVLCAGMGERYRAYLAGTDELMDEPSVRIVETALQGHQRMAAERARYVREAAPLAAAASPEQWLARERAMGAIVAHGEGRRAIGARA
jgi:hypothetical protein